MVLAFQDETIRRTSLPAWAEEEEQRLLQMIRETELTQREIAQKLGRTEAAVSARLTIMRKRLAAGS
ncbi:DNA-directed RNA polymerase specialized sigma subunit [Bradyrhizobium sp. USDA 4503]